MDERVKAGLVSVAGNTILTISKLIVGIIIGSVSIISEAIHSANDLVASILTVIAVKVSSKPPDKFHQYGHGKIENISGIIEALLIVLAAALIINEAWQKLITKTVISHLSLGIIVMLIASIVNYFVSRYLFAVAKKHDSIALEADGLHLRTDVYTSAGIAVGLIIIKFTGYYWIDPVAAIIVSLFILHAAIKLIIKALRPLMDSAIDEEDLKRIEDILDKYNDQYYNYHALRTRKSGRDTHIDLHLLIKPETSVKSAHDLCEEIEASIKEVIPFSVVLIHVEPVAGPQLQ